MEQTITTQEAIMYAALFNGGVGLVLGLIPLIAGFVKRQIKYGIIGFLGTLVGGAALGIILSVPVCAVFTWLILRGPKPPREVVVVNKDPIDVSVKTGDDR